MPMLSFLRTSLTRLMIIFYCIRIETQPGGPGPHIYIPHQQGSPVVPTGTGFGSEVLALGQSQSWSYTATDGQSMCLGVEPQAPIWGLWSDSYSWQNSWGCVDVGRPLWQEDGPVVYNCCWTLSAQSISGLNPTGIMTTFYYLKFALPQTGRRPGPCIYISQE
jgi:hypothetical protein